MIDSKGAGVADMLNFTVKEFINIPPSVEITAPADSSVFDFGEEITFTIESSDSDGSIIRVEVFLNSRLILRFPDTLYTFVLDTLSAGTHEIIARAKDDRGDRSSDTIHIFVDDGLTSLQALAISSSDILIYPNPVSNTLFFSHRCDFEIYTITGGKILEGREALQVNVSNLKEGMYLVKANGGVFMLKKE